MTGNNYLLDTNIIIEVFSGNESITDKISKIGTFYISSIILGELYVGINRVSNKAKHLKKLDDFLNLCIVVEVDELTAQHFGEITAGLFKKGKPIPSNDIWIAATSKQHNLILVTRDNHFSEVKDISVEYWQ